MNKTEYVATVGKAIEQQIYNLNSFLTIIRQLPNNQTYTVAFERVLDSLVNLMLHYNSTLEQILTSKFSSTILADAFIPQELSLDELDANYEGFGDEDGDDVDYV